MCRGNKNKEKSEKNNKHKHRENLSYIVLKNTIFVNLLGNIK